MNIIKSIVSLKVITVFLLLFNLSSCLLADSQVNLLELDEVAGKALMAQILVEAKALKINFDTTYAGIPAVSMCFLNHSNCPTLYNLIKALIAKVDLPKDFDWVCMGFRQHAIACQVEQHQAIDGVLAGTGLTVGYEVLETVTYNELIALLAHEVGHIKLQHLDTKLKVQLVAGSVRTGLWILYAHYNNVYTDPTVWGNIKDHFKFSFSAKGLASGAALTLAQLYAMSYVSQRFEYQADRFSNEIVNQPTALIDGINKLEHMTLIKNPISIKLVRAAQIIGLSTHPTTKNRAAYLAKLAKEKRLNQNQLVPIPVSN